VETDANRKSPTTGVPVDGDGEVADGLVEGEDDLVALADADIELELHAGSLSIAVKETP
jgi:hypothetical protein